MPADAAGRAAQTPHAGPLAVIAGAGDLPHVIAGTVAARGRDVLVVAVEGEADRDYSAFHHVRLPIGAAGRLKAALQKFACTEVLMAGAFRRPRFSDIEFDFGTVKLALSTILKLRFGGDDRVVGAIVRIFESEGFHIVGPREVVPELLSPKGALGRHKPTRAAREEIACGVEAIGHMGQLDIGQAVVALDRRIVAVEAAEGTTAMIERCSALKAAGRLRAEPSSGVVVKMTKPGQETRLDLPVIGVETVRAAAVAGLAGIAVEAEGVLLVGADAVRDAADAAGLFVWGVEAPPANAVR